MSAVRDISCDLIERPLARWTRMLPHAADLRERMSAGTSAASTLLDHGCLIRNIAVSDDRVRIRLHRTPPACVFDDKPAIHCRPDGAQWIAATRWADIDLEWPVEVRS